MKILKNIMFFAVICLISYNFAGLFGKFYLVVFPYETAGSFLDGTALIGLPLIYIFFLSFIFTAFGDKNKYWWVGILLLPAVLFEVVFDFRHIYFPIIVGLTAWFLGKGVELIFSKKLKKI